MVISLDLWRHHLTILRSRFATSHSTEKQNINWHLKTPVTVGTNLLWSDSCIKRSGTLSNKAVMNIL